MVKKQRTISLTEQYSSSGKSKSVGKYVSIILSALIALAAAWYLHKYTATHQTKVLALYTTKDVPAYSLITKDDLEYKYVPIGGIEQDSAVNPSQVINKYAKDKLYANEQINLKRLADVPSQLNGRQIMSVPTTLSTSVGGTLVPGDHVNVWIPSGTSPILGATDAVVVQVENANGQSVRSSSGININLAAGTTSNVSAIPAIVTLAVNPQDVSKMVNAPSGHAPVLVKILAPDVPLAEAAPVAPLAQIPAGKGH